MVKIGDEVTVMERVRRTVENSYVIILELFFIINYFTFLLLMEDNQEFDDEAMFMAKLMIVGMMYVLFLVLTLLYLLIRKIKRLRFVLTIVGSILFIAVLASIINTIIFGIFLLPLLVYILSPLILVPSVILFFLYILFIIGVEVRCIDSSGNI